MHKHWLVTFVSAALAVGCGGAGRDNSRPLPTPWPSLARFSCEPVGGGDARVEVSCTHCSGAEVTDAPSAIDTDLDTAATVRANTSTNDPAGQQSIFDIRAIAQAGVVFPAGNRAGLIFGLPISNPAPFTAAISTYLDENQIDSRSFSSDEFAGKEGEPIYLGLDTTTATFNAVKLTLTLAGGGAEEQAFRLYEFCADGASRFQ